MIVVVQTLTGKCQSNEFTVYPNGLVYSDTTMTQLKYIVDSLNLKFRHCDLNKQYYSAQQGIADYIDFKDDTATAAFHDIQNGVSYADFTKKYAAAGIETGVLITKERQQYASWLPDIDSYTSARPDDDNPSYVELCHTPPGAVEQDHYSIKGAKGNWVFDYTKKVGHLDPRLRAFYITRPPEPKPIPDKYAKLILYADCMIDTACGIFNADAWNDRAFFFSQRYNLLPPQARMDAFNNYVTRETDNVFKKYRLPAPRLDQWKLKDSLVKAYVRDSLSGRPEFMQLLEEGVKEALQYKPLTNDYFEYLTAKYYSKSAALAMKRNRRVMGRCSADERPRMHAINIALLAAETANWQVFLRAHLDIMNDRFERVSDGNYAWAARKTYIREIEDLDIDVQDLMLGISLYAGNAPQNHYTGSIGRLGRAFAETKYRETLEQKLLSMISDGELDAYNRLLMRCLYLNYAYYLPRKEDRMACLQKLEEADKTLPACIASRIKTNKAVYEQGNVRR